MTHQEALEKLELDSAASPSQIEQSYQELYNEFQMRITNAPTEHQRKLYRKKLDELEAAYEMLSRQGSGAADLDLPQTGPSKEEPVKPRSEPNKEKPSRFDITEDGVADSLRVMQIELLPDSLEALQEIYERNVSELSDSLNSPRESIRKLADEELEEINWAHEMLQTSIKARKPKPTPVEEPKQPTRKPPKAKAVAPEKVEEEKSVSPEEPKVKSQPGKVDQAKPGGKMKYLVIIALVLLVSVFLVLDPFALLVSEATKTEYAELLAKGDENIENDALGAALVNYRQASEVWNKGEVREKIERTEEMLLERDQLARLAFDQALTAHTIGAVDDFKSKFGDKYPGLLDSATAYLKQTFWSGTFDAQEKGCRNCVSKNTSFATLPDGSLYLFGQSTTAKDQSNAALVKVSVPGEQVWTKEFDFGNWDNAESIIATKDGNLVLLLFSTFETVHVVKVNPDGEEIWNTKLEGLYALNFAPFIVETDDQELMLYKNREIFVTAFRLSADGEILSDKQTRATYRDYTGRFVVDADKNIFVVEAGVMRKVSPDLKIEGISFPLPMKGKLFLRSIVATNDGRFLVSGLHQDENWKRRAVFGFVNNDLSNASMGFIPNLVTVNDMIETADGNLLAVGVYGGRPGMIKMDENGKILWQWNADENGHLDQVVEKENGQLTAVGTKETNNTNRIYMVNLDKKGRLFNATQ